MGFLTAHEIDHIDKCVDDDTKKAVLGLCGNYTLIDRKGGITSITIKLKTFGSTDFLIDPTDKAVYSSGTKAYYWNCEKS